MFGVSGVLNSAHGAIMVVAAVAAWAVERRARAGGYVGAPCSASLAAWSRPIATYSWWCGPIQRSAAIPRDETEIFVLTGTLLWGIMIQDG